MEIEKVEGKEKMKPFEKREVQRIARERIELLFGYAEKEWKAHRERSNRYVELARRIAMRYNIRLGKELNTRFCKECGFYWVLGESVKVRTNPETKATEYTCTACGHRKRFGYSREKRQAKRL